MVFGRGLTVKEDGLETRSVLSRREPPILYSSYRTNQVLSHALLKGEIRKGDYWNGKGGL